MKPPDRRRAEVLRRSRTNIVLADEPPRPATEQPRGTDVAEVMAWFSQAKEDWNTFHENHPHIRRGQLGYSLKCILRTGGDVFRKGLYTQGVAILLQEKLDLRELENLLHRFAPIEYREAAADWALSGPALFLPYRPDINGYVAVDLVERLWPDEMSDAVLPAWLLGHFGPFTYPGNLERAVQHSYHWPEAAEAVAAHRAFLRIRLSYVFGASGDSPTIPKDCNPQHELEFLIRLVAALLEHPSALCYFNPGGEMLATGSALDHYRQVDRLPIEWLANRRMFRIEGSDWILMDTVGLGQLDLPDLEICVPGSKHDPNDVARTLLNTAHYLAQAGAEIKSGETIDGPGGKSRFWAQAFEESKTEPLRPTLRFRPDDGSVPPSEFGFALPKKKAWQFWKR